MDELDQIMRKDYLEELQNTCRNELIMYPGHDKLPIKQRVKNVLKRIVGISSRADKFFWPNGLLSIALEHTYKSTNDQKDLEYLIKYYDNWIKKGAKVYNLDNVINGYSMVYIYEQTNDLKYKIILDSLVEYIIKHPVDKYGSLPYRVNIKGEMSDIFIDSLGMICPFLCRYGKHSDNEDIVELAIVQLKNFIEYGMNKDKNLPYHAYNAESKIKSGIIGWGRAAGWLLMGLVDSLEYIDPTHEEYAFLCNSVRDIVSATVEYQDDNGYFSWQLEAIEGPIDTSTTSMISYAIGKSIKIGILENSYNDSVEKAIRALYTSTKDGYVGDCSAECRGISMYPQKYGCYPWAQGPTTALVAMCL